MQFLLHLSFLYHFLLIDALPTVTDTGNQAGRFTTIALLCPALNSSITLSEKSGDYETFTTRTKLPNFVYNRQTAKVKFLLMAEKE